MNPYLQALAVLIVILLVGSIIFMRIGFYPKVLAPEETLRRERENNPNLDYDEILTWPKEEIQVSSPYGYSLYGWFIPYPGSDKVIVLSHGITYSLYGSLKYAQIFRDLGFNILVYENRFHGRSGGPNCSFGFFEKDDLKTVIDWVVGKLGPQVRIGTHGESLGAAITLQHAALDHRLQFAIADCSFSDTLSLFAIRMRADYHLPAFPLLYLTRWVTSLLLGFDFAKASPIQGIKQISCPLLFVHGANDTYIPPWMSEKMYAIKQKDPQSRLYLVMGAEHAQSIVHDYAAYRNEVIRFFEPLGLTG